MPLLKRFCSATHGSAAPKTINGLYMLIYQALRAQEIWLDIKFTDAEVREIAAHVQAELDRRDAQ